MKTLILLWLLLLVAACAKGVTPKHWELAETLCEPNGGVSRMYVYDNTASVYCRNGARFRGSIAE